MEKVRYTLETLPEVSKKDWERAFSVRSDDIDFSDIPDMSGHSLRPRQTVDRTMYRPIKVTVTCKLDADIVAWLKQGGKGYQTRLNSILRQVMTHAH